MRHWAPLSLSFLLFVIFSSDEVDLLICLSSYTERSQISYCNDCNKRMYKMKWLLAPGMSLKLISEVLLTSNFFSQIQALASSVMNVTTSSNVPNTSLTTYTTNGVLFTPEFGDQTKLSPSVWYRRMWNVHSQRVPDVLKKKVFVECPVVGGF